MLSYRPQPFSHPPPLLRALRVLLILAQLAGLGLLAAGLDWVYDGQSSLAWPQVPGAVVADTPEVVYRYRVGGERFLGRRIDFGPPRATPLYVPGTPVRVAYDPQRPGASVLEPGVSRGAMLTALTGGALLGAGFLIYGRIFKPGPVSARSGRPRRMPWMVPIFFLLVLAYGLLGLFG